MGLLADMKRRIKHVCDALRRVGFERNLPGSRKKRFAGMIYQKPYQSSQKRHLLE